MKTVLLCALFLLLSPASQAQAEPASDTTPDSVPLGVPGEVPAAELWRRFIERGDLAAISSPELAEALAEDQDELSAELCSSSQATLQASLKRVPVSIALWYRAYKCAETLGDDAGAEQALTAVGALSTHALSLNPAPDSGDPPAPILHERDAVALLEAMGLEMLYAYHDPISNPRYLPLVIAAIDNETGRERLFEFDFLDTWMRLAHREPKSEFPAFRSSTARAYLQDIGGSAPQSPAATALLLLQAFGQDSTEERHASLAAAAAQGHVAAALKLADECLHVHNENKCGSIMIDALLPFAEAGLARPTIDLALAHSLGRGVRRDTQAAGTLLQRAIDRLGRDQAVLLASRRSLFRVGNGMLLKPLREMLSDYDENGDPEVRQILIFNKQVSRASIKSEDVRFVESSSHAVWPSLRALHAQDLELRRADPHRVLAMLKLAAEGGRAEHQTQLLRQMLHLGMDRSQPEDFERWLAAAGHGGSGWASWRLGERLEARGELRRAQGWYLSSQMRGDPRGGVALADLVIRGGDGVEGDAVKALELLRQLAKVDFPPARHALAGLLHTGSGEITADPAESSRLYLANIEEDYSPSLHVLGEAVLARTLPAPTGFDAEASLRKAARKDDAEAMDILALAIAKGRTQRGNVDEAIDLFERAASLGEEHALNNLAWTLCTSPREEFYDPAKGLSAALRMAALKTRFAYHDDTLATCHAANGDFAQAVAVLQNLLESEQADQIEPERKRGYQIRLDRFKAGQPFRSSLNPAPEPATD